MRTIFWDTQRKRTNRGRGFTLVELLIVISIIGVLVAMLMPAVQSAQESGRRAQCSNNLHQMALGCRMVETQYGYFPSGGYGWQMAGDPNRGYGAGQPGGWHYNILPFIDMADLHDMGKGVSESVRQTQGELLAQTPVAVFVCPTRHKLQVYPYVHGAAYVNITDPTTSGAHVIARSDYAANAGSTYLNVQPGNPNTSYAPNFDWSTMNGTVNSNIASGYLPATGVIYRASQCTTSMIKDGASNTYLIGERYLCSDCYNTGSCCDNDQGWDEGYDYDTIRGTGYGYLNLASLPSATTNPPMQDRHGYSTNGGCSTNFGSSHPAGFNMAFAGGEVMKMNYDIDPVVHMQLGHRADGEPTDLSKINANK